MLNRVVCLLLLLPIYSHSIAQYCVPDTTGQTANAGIGNVQLNEINYASPYSEGYQDYTILADTATVTRSVTEVVSLTLGKFQFYSVFIDWNQNDTFDIAFPSNEAYSMAAAGPGIGARNVKVPLGAKLGYTRMRVAATTSFVANAIPCNTAMPDGDMEDYVVLVTEKDMIVDSVHTIPLTYKCFPSCRQDKLALKVEVHASYTLTPLVVNDFSFSTLASTNPGVDILSARLYKTDKTNKISFNQQFGTTSPSPNGNFNFTDTDTLEYGINYYWLVLDISALAADFNLIEVGLNNVDISTVSYLPSASSLSFSEAIDKQSNYRRKEANVWYTDKNLGIDFNCELPTIINDHQSLGGEGLGAICSEKGSLLFYADQSKIFNRAHLLMPNGNNIKSKSSKSTDLFLKKPGSDSIYYLVTTPDKDTMYYTTIDLSLDNGLGDVVSGTKNTLLMTGSLHEAFGSVRHCNKKDYWIITTKNATKDFYAFLVDDNGINVASPVITNVPGSPTYTNIGRGVVKTSPNGKWLVVTTQSGGATYLFNFDNATGIVSNPLALNSSNRHSAAFSPDNTKLYMGRGGVAVDQYDLCDADILGSRTFVGNNKGANVWLMQTAPDGKIYMNSGSNQDYYSVVNEPNLLAPACNFQTNGIYLDGLLHSNSLGFVSVFDENIFNESILDTNVIGFVTDTPCFGFPMQFTDTTYLLPGCPVPADVRTWFWDFGDGDTSYSQNPQHTYLNPGSYLVTFAVSEGCETDTIYKLIQINQFAQAGTDTTICLNEFISIGDTFSIGRSYSWTSNPSGFTANTASVNISPTVNTNYYFEVFDSIIGCNYYDTVNVVVNALPNVVANPDTSICPNESVSLSANGAIIYSWTPIMGLNNAIIANPIATVVTNTTYIVSGLDSNLCENFDTVEITIVSPGQVVAGVDTIIIPGSSVDISASSGFLSYFWSPATDLVCSPSGNNCMNPTVSPTVQTTYVITATDSFGCVSYDSVTIEMLSKFYIPNAFSPNGDGINDLLKVTGFNIDKYLLRIYDRWGNKVFETKDINESWDGKYRNAKVGTKIQKLGVFVYYLDVSFLDGEILKEQGNITLVK